MTSSLFHISIGFLVIGLVQPHPQCLNFRPPHRPTTPLRFCSEYSTYTCCTRPEDKQLQRTYNLLQWKYRRNRYIRSTCYDTLKEIMCLKCHPYAAHIYDAETPDSRQSFQKFDVNFPGLCYPYCMTEFRRCKLLLRQLFLDRRFQQFAMRSTSEGFCKWAEISDKAYCYPAIKNIDKEMKVEDNALGVELCVEQNENRFANGLLAVHAGDGSHRLFVGEQTGKIFVLDENGKKLKEPFLDLTNSIINSGEAWDERGLLGMAFHPQYRTNGHLYIYYSAPSATVERGDLSDWDWYWGTSHTIRVSEFVVSSTDPNKADPSSEMVILQVDEPEANHNGGMIFFGTHDGYLYISLGDGGGAGDPWKTGMRLNTLLGKILRVDVNDQEKLYGIPPDNPFVGRSDARPEIFAYGARNMWRCSQDLRHRIFCGDVGQGRFEEINIIEKGKNYGWSAYEGFSCYNRTLCSKPIPDIQFPILSYDHKVGQSIVGGYVYRGCDNPNLFGKYIYGDTMNGRLFVAEEFQDTGEWSVYNVAMGDKSICNQKLTGRYFKNILTFGENEAGELFFLSAMWPSPSVRTTGLFRLVDPALRGDPEECTRKISVRKPQLLGSRIVRRNIYAHHRRELSSTPSPCKDEIPDLCRYYFGSRNGRRPRAQCRSYLTYTQKNCKRTCGYC